MLLARDGIEAWIRARVDPSGPVELVHERPWGTVLRVPVAGGAAWFKALAPVQAFEPRLTAVLARRWPDRLPEVLAHDEERRWLLLADAGGPIGFDAGLDPWLAVLPRYAALQRGEAAHAAEHLQGGVPDRRLARFADLYEGMLARELPLAADEVAQLHRFAPRFAELCVELSRRGIPETIQHDDLHGANVHRDDGVLRVLDWGDSCVSHPFLTAYVAFVHLDELRGPDDPRYARLRDAYLEAWGRPDELRDTFELSQRLGPFAHLFKELRVLDAIPERDRPDLMPNLPALLVDCLAVAL